MARAMSTYKISDRVSGICIASVGRDSFTLTFKPKDAKDRPVKISFDLDELPEGFEIQNKEWYWANTYRGHLEDIRPESGKFVVKFNGLSKKGDDIWWRIAAPIYDKNKQEGQFVANAEVVEGPFAGTIYPYYVKFTYWDDKKKEAVVAFRADRDGYMEAGELKQLGIFLRFSGIANDCDIEYDDDLDTLFLRIHKKVRQLNRGNDNTFLIKVEDGKIRDLAPMLDVDDDYEDDDDDAVVSKSKARDFDDEDEEEETPAPRTKKSRPDFDED